MPPKKRGYSAPKKVKKGTAVGRKLYAQKREGRGPTPPKK